MTTLERIVGSNLLGLDSGNVNCKVLLPAQNGPCGLREWEDNGLYPETNLAYGVAELGSHDPVIPQSYLDSWPVPDAAQISTKALLFAPNINSVALARRYGVRYVLALPDEPTPPGMRLVAHISGQPLYLVPDSGRFTFVDSAALKAVVITASQPNDDRYVLSVKTPHAAILTAKITAFEGWHATANGRSVPVLKSSGDLLSVSIPAGTTQITLYYRPRAFVEGLLLGGVALVGFFAAAVVTRSKRRRALMTARI